MNATYGARTAIDPAPMCSGAASTGLTAANSTARPAPTSAIPFVALAVVSRISASRPATRNVDPRFATVVCTTPNGTDTTTAIARTEARAP